MDLAEDFLPVYPNVPGEAPVTSLCTYGQFSPELPEAERKGHPSSSSVLPVTADKHPSIKAADD